MVDLIERDALPEALDETRWADWPAWQELIVQFDKDLAVATLEVPRMQATMADAVRTLARPKLGDDATVRNWMASMLRVGTSTSDTCSVHGDEGLSLASHDSLFDPSS
jgi:hypothetical protein